MKIAKVILLIILILKTSGLISLPSSSCCDDKIEASELVSELPDENKDCGDDGCCGGVCDCLCCSHVFTYQKVTVLSVNEHTYFQKNTPLYIQTKTDQYGEPMWQPPRQV